MDVFNQLGAVITASMGAFGLAAPAVAARLVGLEATAPHGGSEFRATYGGLFVALGALPLALGDPLLYALAGACWLGAAIGRIISITLDRAVTHMNAAATGFEAAVGALLMQGAPFRAVSSLIHW
jgi:hypothetical protein